MLMPRLAAQIQRREEIVIDGNRGLRINPCTSMTPCGCSNPR